MPDWPAGVPMFTDTERMDFIETHGLEYVAGDFSALVGSKTVFEEFEPGEERTAFNLRKLIDFAIHRMKKEGKA